VEIFIIIHKIGSNNGFCIDHVKSCHWNYLFCVSFDHDSYQETYD
jgi:hypothetical protein